MNKKQQSGFTLIELVVVIVILGILAATALPKFVDLSSDAGNAAANGVAGALASASAVNYSAQVAGSSNTVTGKLNTANVCTSTNLQPFISGVTLGDGATNTASSSTYNVSGTGACNGASAAGTAVSCSIIGYKGVAQTATIICSKS